ncbi:MAG TPA: protease inhibitor I9 family protein, partial [Pedococcus sp.]
MPRRPHVRRGVRRLATLVAATGLAGATLTPTAAPAAAPERAEVRLVTLEGTGVAGYDGPRTRAEQRAALVAVQDEVLARIGADEPLYRWTTALNGFAVRLDDQAVRLLETDPRVVGVEDDDVLPLA